MQINIHTHHPNEDTFCLQNIRYGMENIPRKGYYSLGLHPWDIQRVNEGKWEKEFKSLAEDSRCLAIGECGLDRLIELEIQFQIPFFEAQIDLANQITKPLIIHNVRAQHEIMHVLRRTNSQVPIIVHGFNQGLEKAKEWLKLGAHLGFGMSVLNNQTVRNLLPQLPLDSIFLETDDVELLSIDGIYREVSDICKISKTDLETQLESNFKAVFNYGPQELVGANGIITR